MSKANYSRNKRNQNRKYADSHQNPIEAMIGSCIAGIGVADKEEMVCISLSEYKTLVSDSAKLDTVKKIVALHENDSYVSSVPLRYALGILKEESK